MAQGMIYIPPSNGGGGGGAVASVTAGGSGALSVSPTTGATVVDVVSDVVPLLSGTAGGMAITTTGCVAGQVFTLTALTRL